MNPTFKMQLIPGMEDHDRAIMAEVQTQDCYRVRELAAAGFAPKVIADVGAHIGTFSTMARHYFPLAKIYAFEPDKQRADLFALNVPDAVIVNVGVIGFYGKEQEADVYPSVNTFEQAYRRREATNAICAQEMLSTCGGTIDLLKIDCEESEVNIFRELSAMNAIHNIAVISGEWHFAILSRR